MSDHLVEVVLQGLGRADEGQQAGAHDAGAIEVSGDVVGLVAGGACRQ